MCRTCKVHTPAFLWKIHFNDPIYLCMHIFTYLLIVLEMCSLNVFTELAKKKPSHSFLSGFKWWNCSFAFLMNECTRTNTHTLTHTCRYTLQSIHVICCCWIPFIHLMLFFCLCRCMPLLTLFNAHNCICHWIDNF